MLDIQVSLTHIHPSNDPDTIIWTPSRSENFHLGSTWNFLRAYNPKVPWYPLVWFKGVIPKHDSLPVLASISIPQILSLFVYFMD